jgi:hypothetical protein
MLVSTRTNTTPAAAPADGNPAAVPIGRRLVANLSPAMLRPGAGREVQRTGESSYCGRIWGRVFGYTEHPNARDKTRISRRFAGSFGFTNAKGEQSQATECYLPGTLERGLKAALDISQQPVSFAVEIWCEPDAPERTTPLGYSYGVYNRLTQDAAVDEIAYAAGILPRPEPEPTLIGHEIVDGETGEVTEAAE